MRVFGQWVWVCTHLHAAKCSERPGSRLSGKPFAFIRQGRFYQFAFGDDLTGPSECSGAGYIDCSPSIIGSDIDCAEIAKLPYVFFKPSKRRRGNMQTLL